MAESDEVGEELDRVLRVTLTAAGQLGEAAARRNAELEREAARASREDAAALQRETAAQRDGARLVSRQAADSRFWQHASPQEVGQVWEAAVAWRAQDPQAAAAADLVRSAVQRKWGLDVDALTATGDGRGPRQQAQDLVNAISDQAAARDERRDAAADRSTADQLEQVGRAQDATVGPGAGADERDLAEHLREGADVRDERAAADLYRAAYGQPVGAGTAAGVGGYERARAEELRDVPAAAAAARLDSAAGFPVPTHEAIATKGASKARVARGPGAGAGREHDRTR